MRIASESLMHREKIVTVVTGKVSSSDLGKKGCREVEKAFFSLREDPSPSHEEGGARLLAADLILGKKKGGKSGVATQKIRIYLIPARGEKVQFIGDRQASGMSIMT